MKIRKKNKFGGSCNKINEYANSMFRHEYLHEQWLSSCEKYLYSIFGDSVKGKIVMDYAFGRGNWSIAFTKIGAAKVISIDASADNTRKFSAYCRKHKINNIEVIHGNILKQGIHSSVDLFWVYGILNNINNPSLFLAKLKSLARNENARFFIYHYDARSLRQYVVEACRRILTYRSESKFVKDSFLLIPAARMRARDDLTAPYVTFVDALGLDTILRKSGIAIKKACPSFLEFQTGSVSLEFMPYHFLCDLNNSARKTIRNEPRQFLKDIEILKELTNCLLVLDLSPSEKKKLAIGLYNTNFASLQATNNVPLAIINIFLFLFHAIVHYNVSYDSFSTLTCKCLVAAHRSLRGENPYDNMRKADNYYGKSFLIDYLNCNNIRI